MILTFHIYNNMMIHQYAVVYLSLLFFIGISCCEEVQNSGISLEQKSEIVQYGKDAQNDPFRSYMENFMKVARERYSEEMKKDTAFEDKLRFFIETGDQDLLPYLIDEELVYLERHADDSTLREKLWKKYLVDSDGYFAELNEPVVMLWLLYSDKVTADVYREAWERRYRGNLEKFKNRYADVPLERMIYKDYFDNILARLYPLAGKYDELKKDPDANSFYRDPSFHHFEEFVREYRKKGNLSGGNHAQ